MRHRVSREAARLRWSTVRKRALKFRGPLANGSQARGAVENVEYLRGCSALRLRVMLKLARPPEPVPIEQGVDLYRVSYWTEHLGRPELASGLYALPRSVTTKATVTWMNGTNPTRAEAPS